MPRVVDDRVSVELANCALANAVATIGDQWSLLILREALCGVTRFEQMRGDLGIPRSVLADRLAKLVENGILEKFPRRAPGQRAFNAYRLTARGVALIPALVALRQWAQAHVMTEPSRLVAATEDGRLVETALTDESGSPVDPGRVVFRLRTNKE